MDTFINAISPVVSPLLSSRFMHSTPAESPRRQDQLISPRRTPHPSLITSIPPVSSSPLSPRDVRTLLPEPLAVYAQSRHIPLSNRDGTAAWIRKNQLCGRGFMDLSEDILQTATNGNAELLSDLLKIQTAIRGAHRKSTRRPLSLHEISTKIMTTTLPTPPDSVLIPKLAEIEPSDWDFEVPTSSSQEGDEPSGGLQLIGAQPEGSEDYPVVSTSHDATQEVPSNSHITTLTSTDPAANTSNTASSYQTNVPDEPSSRRPIPPRVDTSRPDVEDSATRNFTTSPSLLSAMSLGFPSFALPPSTVDEKNIFVDTTPQGHASTSQLLSHPSNSSLVAEVVPSIKDDDADHNNSDLDGSITPSKLTGMTLVQSLPSDHEHLDDITAKADKQDHDDAQQESLIDVQTTPQPSALNIPDAQEDPPPNPDFVDLPVPTTTDQEQPTSDSEGATKVVPPAQEGSNDAEATLEKEQEGSLSVASLPDDPSHSKENGDSAQRASVDTGGTIVPSGSNANEAEEEDTKTSSSSTLAEPEPSQDPFTDQSNPAEQSALREALPAGSVPHESQPSDISENSVEVPDHAAQQLVDEVHVSDPEKNGVAVADASEDLDKLERKDESGHISTTTKVSNNTVPPVSPSDEETPSVPPPLISDPTTHSEDGSAEKPVDKVTVNSDDNSSSPSSFADRPEIGPNALPTLIDESTSTNLIATEETKTLSTSEVDPSHGSSSDQPDPAGKSASDEGSDLPPISSTPHEPECQPSNVSENPIEVPDHISQPLVSEAHISAPDSEKEVIVAADTSQELNGRSAVSQDEDEHKDGGGDTSTTKNASNDTVLPALSTAEETPSVRTSDLTHGNEDGSVDKSITNDDDTFPLSTAASVESESGLDDLLKSIDPSVFTNSVDGTDTEASPDTEADTDDVTKLDDCGTQTADQESKSAADRVNEEENCVVGEGVPQAAAATESIIIPPTVFTEQTTAGSDVQITTDEAITETAISDLANNISAEPPSHTTTEDFDNITNDDLMDLDEDYVDLGLITPTLTSLDFEQSFTFVSNADVLLIDLGVEEDEPEPIYPSSALQSWIVLLEDIFAMPTPALSFVGELESEDKDVDDFVSVATPRQPPAGLQLTTGCETPRPPVSVDLPPPGGDDKSTEQETDESTGDNAENQQRSVVDAEHVSMSRPQDSMFAPQQPISTLNLSRLQDEPDISPHLTVTSEENPESTAGDSVLATYQLVSQPTEMETITLFPHATDIPHGKPDDNSVTPTTTSTSDAETIRELQLRIKDLEARLAFAEARSRCRQRTNSDPPPFTHGASSFPNGMI